MAILKKVVGVVKGVIILDIYLLLIFIPHYEPSPPPCKVMTNSMSSCWYYRHYHKGCMFVAVRSLF